MQSLIKLNFESRIISQHSFTVWFVNSDVQARLEAIKMIEDTLNYEEFSDISLREKNVHDQPNGVSDLVFVSHKLELLQEFEVRIDRHLKCLDGFQYA